MERSIHINDVAILMKMVIATHTADAPTRDFSIVVNGKRVCIPVDSFTPVDDGSGTVLYYKAETTIPVENTHIPARDYQMDPTFAIMKGLNINTIDPVWSQFKILYISFSPCSSNAVIQQD